MAFMGYDGSSRTGKTELWNGTNWTETTDMGTARQEGAGGGASSAAALAAGGYTTTAVATTEEWTGAGTGVTRTFTDS